MPSLHDTRVLQNLIKSEKEAASSLKKWTTDASSASAAMSAWSVADSGDTQDLMDVSIRISQLLSSCSESQREYLHALNSYRLALKDVLDRETALKTVVRDREILVSRLMKLGNKKPSDSAFDKHQNQLEDAQRELTACETFLQDEEMSLSSAKRRSFKEALALRMKAMGEFGRVLEESAAEAQQLLSELEGPGMDEPTYLEYQPRGRQADDSASVTDSITPSNSASQALSRSNSDDSIYEDEQPPPRRTLSPEPRATSPRRAIGNSGLSGAPPGRLVVNRPSGLRSPVAASVPRPIMAPVPTAPRSVSTYLNQEQAPAFDIPKAPANVTSRRAQDSSDEEDEREFEAHQNGVAAGQRSNFYPNDAPNSTLGNTNANAGRLRRRAMSDTSSITAGGGKRRNSIFGGFANLFKKKDKRRNAMNDDEDDFRSSIVNKNWDTRIDKNVYAAKKQNAGLDSIVANAGRVTKPSDSSDDDTPKNLVRVVNDPSKRFKAMSDVGRNRSSAASFQAPSITKKKKKSTRAASDLGAITPSQIHASILPPMHRQVSSIKAAEPAPRIHPTRTTGPSIAETGSLKKKKKKIDSTGEPMPNSATGTTIVLSAERLGIPASTTKSSGMSRSNTVTSNATTTTTGTMKKKKKKTLTDGTIPQSSQISLVSAPSAADLANSLPSARRSNYNAITSPLPLPEGTAGSTAMTPSASQTTTNSTVAGKVPKSLAANERRSKSESMRHGAGNWVNHGESLMSLVEKGEAETGLNNQNETQPSRKYGAAGNENSRAPTANNSGGGALTKRKSVRLAEGPDSLAVPTGSHQPNSSASSIKSEPRHGILKESTGNGNSGVGSAALTASPSKSWDTRANTLDVQQDSSDEEDVEYRKARKAFAKNTKGMDQALGGKFTAEEKGKGKA